MGNSVRVTVTGGTTDRMSDLEGTVLGLVLPSGQWIRKALKKGDASENSNELNVLSEGRVFIRLGVRRRVERILAAPPPLLLQFEGKIIALQADVSVLLNLTDDRGTGEVNTSTTECQEAAREEIKIRRLREKRKKMLARRMMVTSPMLWLPCLALVDLARPRWAVVFPFRASSSTDAFCSFFRINK